MMKSPISAAVAAALSSPSSSSSATTSSLTLFGPAFTRVFRCLWMLEELGISYTHVPRTFPGSRRAKELHPLGKVPMLVENYQTDDAFVITESANINQYLADKYGNGASSTQQDPSTRLFVPQAGTRLRARHDQLLFTIMTELDAQGVWVHRKHDSMGETFGHFPEVVERAQLHFDQVTKAICETTLYIHYEQQQQQLQQQQSDQQKQEENDRTSAAAPIYLLGPNLFSPADILFVHTLGWAKAIQWGKESWQQDAVLTKYLETCHQRPAYQRAAAIRRDENLLPKKAPEGETTASAAPSAAADDQPSKL